VGSTSYVLSQLFQDMVVYPLARSLTWKEIDEVATLEANIVRESGDLSDQELEEFKIIIHAKMYHIWTYEDYLVYMAKKRGENHERECRQN